jgi:hypothetical protein
MGIRELELNDKFRNDKLLPNNEKYATSCFGIINKSYHQEFTLQDPY